MATAVRPPPIVIPALAAVGLPAWAGLHPRSQLFGPTICKVENGCALTFDDGPNPRLTPKLLTLLNKYRVPATFFVLGKYVRENPVRARLVAHSNEWTYLGEIFALDYRVERL